MLKKGSNIIIVDGSRSGGGGDGVAVASSSIVDVGFSLDGFALPGTSTAHATNNNNILDMNKFVLLGGSSIGDPISSSFKPQLHDMELHRRARNNAILAKIQELEANACVQAARSERLRMMREEYESLVRRYASARKSHWGAAGTSSTNGYFNENNNGFPPNRYLQPFSPQQPPYISLKEPGPPVAGVPSSQPQLLTTTNTHPFISTIYPPTRDSPAGNINRSYVTTGVNTEITGPVKSTVASQDYNGDDLQVYQKRGKVTAIIKDSGSQTFQTIESVLPPVEKMRAQVEVDPETAVFQQQIEPQVATGLLFPSSSSARVGPSIYGTTTNQDAIVIGRDDGKGSLLKPKKNLSSKVEMMLLMLDEEDDESSCQAEERRKQRVENLHHQLKQPKGKFQDDSNSISSSPSTPVGMEFASTSNNTTEEVGFKQRQRQKQQHQLEKVAAEHGNKYQKMRNQRNDEREDETSQDTPTVSFANNNNKRESSAGGGRGVHLSKIILPQQDGCEDVSLSDSTSAFHTDKNRQNQRKKLLEQLATASSTNKGSADDDDEERDIVRSEEKKDEATSESIGDSVMDSIQKTPDLLLPRDDLELQEIAEVNEREHGGGGGGGSELEEIELALKLSSDHGKGSNVGDGVDDALMVTATAVTADTKSPRGSSGINGGSKPIQAQSGVNDMVSVERKMVFKQDSTIEQDGIKELEKAHQIQINDTKEIRPNNLSSSKVDVPAAAAEEEKNNFTHANNPGEYNDGITTSATFHETTVAAAVDSQENEKKNPENDGFDEDVHEKVEFQNSPFCEQDNNRKGDSTGVNESSKKIPHSPAPSANMSASTTSSFSSGSNAEVDGNRETNNPALIAPSSTIPPTTNLPQTHYPAVSSSSSSEQHSLEDQVSGNVVAASTSNNISQTKDANNSGSHQGTPQQAQQGRNHDSSPTLPRSIHKRHQLLEEQVKRKKEENEPTPPVGADVMPERLTTSSDSSSAPVLEPGTEPATNKPDVDINNGTKTISTEKGGTSAKTAKGSVPTAFNVSPATALSPSSSKKASGNANNSTGSAGNGTGSGGGGGGMTNIRPGSGSRSSKMSGKQGPGSNVTVPSGPTGAQNTARRVRLKLHEDSDTDSSEIGSAKSQHPAKGNFSGNKGNTSSSSKPGSINTSKNTLDGHGPQKSNSVDVDDDFDDFYDNF